MSPLLNWIFTERLNETAFTVMVFSPKDNGWALPLNQLPFAMANGNWFNGNAQPLSLGENTITVNAVSFNRSVKIQFNSGDIEFDALSVNDDAQECE